MKIGRLSDFITPKTAFLFSVQFFLVLTFLGYRMWTDSSTECIRCHSDSGKMEKLGYPQFYVTPETVSKESGHPYVECHECHLGDGRAHDADKAHRGMLSVLIVGEDGSVLKRKQVYPEALLPKGSEKINMLLPQKSDNNRLTVLSEVRNVLWHDRNPETFNFDPAIARKTCGKPGCHPDQLDQFTATVMGTNFRQRTMRTWLKPYGPQN